METCFKILQLKFDKKLTNRCIGLTLHISASTVFEVLARFKASSLSWPLPADISHDTLEKLIFPPKDTFASELVMPDMLYFDTEMRKPGVTRQLLWMEYKAQAGDKAMGYSHFCRCYRALYESGRITEAACMAHARRKIHDVHARAPTYITTEALQRIGELYAIEAEVRGCSAEQRLAARKARAASLMQSLYDWIQTQMKTLSRHSDTAKAFAYLLKQWEGLNVYCSNGQVEIDNNIAENALRGVAVGRKNWMFAGSDSGGEHAAVLYSLMGTCRLNNVEPEKWLRYVIEHIQDWPANRVRDLLPWKVDLTSQ